MDSYNKGLKNYYEEDDIMKNNRIINIIVFFFILDFIILNIICFLTYNYIKLCKVEPVISDTLSINNENYSVKEKKEISDVKQELDNKIESRSSDWNLLLVNPNNAIPNNYMVEVSTIENYHKVDIRIVELLNAMLQEARKQGLNPIICSGYRTHEYQKYLFNRKINQYRNQGYSYEKSHTLAARWIAIPGTSEHETGLAVDIVSRDYQILDEKQEQTDVQKWLMENSYKYGFTLRYALDKENITMINYEPWHYRFVGIENATYMKENNLCLEEYIDYLKQIE